jgi:hypothetical protein
MSALRRLRISLERPTWGAKLYVGSGTVSCRSALAYSSVERTCSDSRMNNLVPKDPTFRERVQSSFEKQGLVSTLGASIILVEPGMVEIALLPSPSVSQQHGFVRARAVLAIADTAAGYAARPSHPAAP